MILWEAQELFARECARVRESNLSAFYREKYAGVPVGACSLEEIPTLSREELVNTPAARRCYVPDDEVAFVAYTSGTTSGNPLVSFFSTVEHYFFEPSLNTEVNRLLITYPPLNKNFSASFVQQCRQAKRPVTPVFADYEQLANSAVIARETGCDAIYATPTIAQRLAEPIARLYDPKRIRLLALSSETLTDAGRKALSRAYPNARIANLYASSEIGQFILFPCAHMLEAGKQEFHILHEALLALELIDGELVVSYGLNKAFPLLRYRTGDFFEVASESCSCGLPGKTLRWGGRSGVDRVRIGGFELYANDVDEAIAAVGIPLDNYQLHFYEESEAGVVTVVLEVQLAQGVDENLFRDLVSRELGLRLSLGPGLSLEQAVQAGRVAPLIVKRVRAFSVPSTKRRRIVSHL